MLITSTRQWNPGDEWIAAGIRRVLADTTGRHINWVLYDRSPDNFESPWTAQTRRDLLGNSWSPPRDCFFDAVVVAGTPAWAGPHLRPVVECFVQGSTPVLFLGIGHISECIELTGDELTVLKRSFVVTRDPLAMRALAAHGIEATLAVCPSLFSAPFEAPARRLRKIAVVMQNDAVINQAIPSGLKREMFDLVRILAHSYEVAVICNYIDEYCEFRERAGVPVFYTYDSAQYFEIMADFDIVISTRLHSAFLANSLLKPAVVTHDSPRVTAALEQCPYTRQCVPQDVPAMLASLDVDAEVRLLLNWKRDMKAHYTGLVAGALRSYGLA
jgi:hypothetical protein